MARAGASSPSTVRSIVPVFTQEGGGATVDVSLFLLRGCALRPSCHLC